MHALEKILAKNSGLDSVSAGQIVTADIDFAEINDLYLQTVYSFYEMGGKKVWDNTKAAFVFDHYAPAPDEKSAQNHKEMREFAKKNNLKYHFDTNCGVCHQVMPEAGLAYPGMILVATDSHTTTHGAFGAFGTGVGATDMATILLTGKLWFRVPEIIEVRLDGDAPDGVYPKDVVLNVLGKLKADGAVYKAIDFTGSYVDQLGVPGRMTICNMAVEMGAKTAYMQPNQKVLDYVSERAVKPYEIKYTDDDFEYEESHLFDVSKMEPTLSCPSSVDNVHNLTSVVENHDVEIDQGYIGSCTGGRFEDIEIAAKILKDKHIPKYKRLDVVPASAEVMQKCIKAGYIQDLMKAGATIAAPGCAACLGIHEGILASGEVCISSTNRNFPGRMGSVEAEIYLASPAAVASSILNGKITDPRKYVSEISVAY
ncbi:isopropylmalate isomerase large subunit [Companilactobacillus nodensis DSM 19682 = JCM 14932 = NBRC 107160]|uniref:3-isopropylmalate dehydratase large subunit n=1 Tax=Companilactobacillus nodensis DSM 19682 = JCM 14932 = NBRC 107160 TaxID=1423775 RepID=A0A0R1K9L2_9LACO|nr:3-isopropylmalate dehydratase large subunit [Companilactobacillus nodensis]KRK80156.1 isopropylmalate isomerase large subunit [Companilactobacillus nodensis DSM 19682 = JCM 14932 = NBRC 107160]